MHCKAGAQRPSPKTSRTAGQVRSMRNESVIGLTHARLEPSRLSPLTAQHRSATVCQNLSARDCSSWKYSKKRRRSQATSRSRASVSRNLSRRNRRAAEHIWPVCKGSDGPAVMIRKQICVDERGIMLFLSDLDPKYPDETAIKVSRARRCLPKPLTCFGLYISAARTNAQLLFSSSIQTKGAVD
jgi:hypothetical protein